MNKDNKTLIIILVLVVVAVVGYFLMTQPDQRTTGERIGDAVDSLSEGVDDAARELEPRTPAERIGDEVRDATDGDPN